MTPNELAQVTDQFADAVQKISSSGVVQTAAFAIGAQNMLIELGAFPGLDKAIKEAEAQGDIVEEPPPDPSPDQLAQTAIQQERQMRQLPPDRNQMAIAQQKRKALPAPRKDGFVDRQRQLKDSLDARLDRIETALLKLAGGRPQEDSEGDTRNAGQSQDALRDAAGTLPPDDQDAS
jgi:hypothetical protein